MLKHLVLLGLVCFPLHSQAFNMNVVADVEAADPERAEDCDEHRGSRMNIADHMASHVQGQNCRPTNRGLESICNFIDNQAPEASGSPNRFVYQTRIYSAACVSPSDSPATRRTKVNAFWNQYGNQLNCNSAGFNVSNGSIIKYAVAKRFDTFVYDVSRNWGVNLNRIDPSDSRTVLDYVLDEKAAAERRGDTAFVSKLDSYKRLLEAAGARRRVDLR